MGIEIHNFIPFWLKKMLKSHINMVKHFGGSCKKIRKKFVFDRL